MPLFKKLDLLLIFVLCIALSHTLTAQVTLTHNIGEIVPSTPSSCSPTFTGRTFDLQDFGIAEDEELIINAAEIAYQIKMERELRAWVTFYVYEIDDNFPDSFSRTTNRLLGKSQLVELETSPTQNGLTPLKTLTANFNIPVTVPSNTKRILVEVEGRLYPNSLHLASTEDETDSTWFNGGCSPYTYGTGDEYGYPDANAYLKVFGEAKVPSGCSDYPISYTATICDPDGDGITQFDSTYWGSNVGGFGNEVSYFYANGDPLPDPLPNPYTNKTPYREVITVRVTDPNTGNCHESERTLITHAPIDIEQPSNLYACDEGNGYAHFDVSAIEAQIIGTQVGLNPSYLKFYYMDANGQELFGFPSASYRNQQPNAQTVYIQVAYDEPFTPSCPAETSFDLIVRPRPQVEPLNDLVVQDDDGDGFAEFDTSGIESAVLGSQTGVDVSYFDAQGSQLPNPLPNPYTNTTPNLETITVRVTDPVTGCFDETPLTLRASNTPIVMKPSNIHGCDEGNGFAYFDVSLIEGQIIGGQTGLNVSYLDASGQVLSNFPSTSYKNLEPYSQTVTASVTDQSDPTFHAETAFDLIVRPLPVAHALPDLIVCDDDGIAEFDTFGVEGAVVGNQTGLEVSYLDAQGSQLPYPLPNPYINSEPYMQTITVVVTNPLTGCTVQTPLTLRTSGTPEIQHLPNLYACDAGDGHSFFDTSSLETQILGERSDLRISYLDTNGQELSGFPSASYRNQKPYSQTVTIRVAEGDNPDCYSETSFDLIVIRPPVIDLQETYYLCDLEPSKTITATPDADSWTWVADDGTILSSSAEVGLSKEGAYTLFMGSTQNGIYCENSASFRLVRTEPTIIQQLNTGEDFSNDNHIEVIASGNGDLEYSIDGTYYQENNIFHELAGGTYTIYVRDKEGCGEDSKETILLDYPKFFSPNSDGINDLWKIEALADFPDAVVQIFDRYGKLLGGIRPGDNGWDGTFQGNPLPSSDYWFTLKLGDGREYKKHFALKR